MWVCGQTTPAAATPRLAATLKLQCTARQAKDGNDIEQGSADTTAEQDTEATPIPPHPPTLNYHKCTPTNEADKAEVAAHPDTRQYGPVDALGARLRVQGVRQRLLRVGHTPRRTPHPRPFSMLNIAVFQLKSFFVVLILFSFCFLSSFFN